MVSTGGWEKAKLTVAVDEAKGIRVCQSLSEYLFRGRVEIIMSPFTVISCVPSRIKGRSFLGRVTFQYLEARLISEASALK